QRSTLPVSAHQSQILEACRGHRAAVVTGDAGCGKSTQVPQYLMDDAPQDGRAAVVLVTQPRRLAAISVAKRVAAERGEAIGSSVGYHVSGDKKEGDSDRARCVYVTTGVLLQLLTHHKDEVLKTYTHLVIDEAHERDVDMDLVLVILRRVLIDAMRAEQRGERVCVPRMVVMSATVDATRMCRFF
ncbi:P-loop containing nucleoside triphosphate hydrolase protein, partial [Pelagophyceae sp. CCMP2097]